MLLKRLHVLDGNFKKTESTTEVWRFISLTRPLAGLAAAGLLKIYPSGKVCLTTGQLLTLLGCTMAYHELKPAW